MTTESDHERVARAARMTVEECCEWMAAATSPWGSEVCDAESRDVPALRFHAREHLYAVRWRRGHYDGRVPHDHIDRINLTMWALCREAVRAIARERGAR